MIIVRQRDARFRLGPARGSATTTRSATQDGTIEPGTSGERRTVSAVAGG
jgi:hypothetical protein